MPAWKQVGDGWTRGRFEIRLASPTGWDLLASGVVRGHYSRASSAKASAERLERLSIRRGGVGLRLAGALALVGLIAVGTALRLELNPDRSAAEALVERIDAAHGAVLGGAPISSISDPDFEAAVVALPNSADVLMLTGEAGGDCYSFYWNDSRGPVARVLVEALPCEPSASSVQIGHNTYQRQTPAISGHLAGPGGGFDWEDVLPPMQRQRPWILPVMVGLAGAILSLIVGASRVALDVDRPLSRRESRWRLPSSSATG